MSKANYLIIIFCLLLNLPPVVADEFIGQWHIFKDKNATISQATADTIAQTIDGANKLQIRVNADQKITITFTLHHFASFGTEHDVFEYRSPTYGKIRTVDYYIDNNTITLKTPYEVNRFIENLKDIATHPMLVSSNLGSSFKERKVTISYLPQSETTTLSNAAFSTIEIDEVLQSLEIDTLNTRDKQH